MVSVLGSELPLDSDSESALVLALDSEMESELASA